MYDNYQLIINQINKVYNTKDENLLPYKELFTKIVSIYLLKVEFDNILRKSHRFIDVIKNVAYLTLIHVDT